jgi:hypothetical protein
MLGVFQDSRHPSVIASKFVTTKTFFEIVVGILPVLVVLTTKMWLTNFSYV